jgi:hypothetical protein
VKGFSKENPTNISTESRREGVNFRVRGNPARMQSHVNNGDLLVVVWMRLSRPIVFSGSPPPNSPGHFHDILVMEMAGNRKPGTGRAGRLIQGIRFL